MDTAVSPPVGQLLGGRYHVGSRIARGGMATVYLGTDTRLDRVVALKLIHPELSDDSEFVRRFIGEARAAARLNSPNVVAIYDQGTDAGVHYLAMEYVPGKTLRARLAERGRLPPRDALDIMAGVLSGLAAAHQAGIAHRDVKPENVLLTAGGQVKVADFGLARAVAGAVQTKGAMIIGTAAYLAPEQVTGGTCDARTDVYAAGVMLFELLTGTQPHTADSPLAVAHKHVRDAVPAPSSILPRLPAALDALVAYATSREPDLRPADAGEFLRAVTDVRNGHPIVLRSRVPHQAPAADELALTGHPSADPVPTPQDGFALQAPGAGPPGAPAQPVLAAAFPDQLPVPADDPYQPVNSTMVVPAGEIELFRGGSGQHGRAHRRQRRRSEPWLQRLVFSGRSGLLAAGLVVLLVLALLGWWLTSGRYATVPQVRGMSVSTARADLRNAGFGSRTGPARHSTLPSGEVIATIPAASSRAGQGATITLVVSLGPVLVPVPSVTGVPLATATAQLKQHGLTPGTVTQAVSSTIAAGIVLSTNPAAGTPWPKNRPVLLTISAGPPLPNFVGQQLAAAQAAAAAGNYQINPVPDAKSNQPANTITGQSPAASTPITPGEVVTVQVSQGPQLVPIPDVHGMPLHDAIQVLRQAGFQVQVNSNGLGDRVAGTTPTGQAPAGSVVTINVGFSFP